MYLGTSFLSLGSTLVLLLGLPFLAMDYRHFSKHTLFRPFCFLVGALLVSIFFAEPFPYQKTLFKLRYFLCLFVSTFVFSRLPKTWDKIQKASLFIPSVLGPLAILQHKQLIGFLNHWFDIPQISHATGFLTHHTAFGLSMVYAFQLLLPRITKSNPKRLNVFLRLSCVLCVVAVLCSFSRGAFAALVVSSGLVFFLQGFAFRKWITLSILVFLFSIPIFLNSSLRDRFVNVDRSKFSDRLELYSFAWDEFKRRPFVGHGFGRFSLELEKYPERKARSGGHGHAHNMFLDFLAGSGVLGLGAFLWYLWVLNSQVWSKFRGAIERKTWFSSLFGIWTAFLVGGLFDEYLLWNQVLIPTMILLGSAFDWPTERAGKPPEHSVFTRD